MRCSSAKLVLVLRQAQHERGITNDLTPCPVRPEPFDWAQDRLVEARGEFIEPDERGVFPYPVKWKVGRTHLPLPTADR